MNLKRLFLGALCAAALAITANADPGIPDTVRAPDVQVNPGDQFGYPVYLYNDEDLSGGTLGFQWHTGDLVLDSISYAGSVLAGVPDGQRPRTINNTEHNVLTGFFTIFDPPVPPGTGIWATFWFTVDAAAADQVVSFDSTKIGPSGDFILIALSGNETISPQYVTGSITIGSPQSNTAPSLDPIANQVVAEGDTLVVGASATDAESTPVLSAEGLTGFMGFSDNGDGTGTLEVTPGYDDDGVYPVMVIASDEELADTAAFDVTVSNVNRAPVWGSVPPQMGPEGSSINTTVYAVDPDGPGLTFSILSAPDNVLLSPFGIDSANVFFGPDFTQAGDHIVILQASDGELTDTLAIMYTITNVNHPPGWGLITNQTTAVGDTLMILVTAGDSDVDDSLVLSLGGTPPANASLIDNGDRSGLFVFAPDSSQAGQSYEITLLASDGMDTGSTTFMVDVEALQVVDTAWVEIDTLYFVGTTGGPNPDNQCLVVMSTNQPANFQVGGTIGAPQFGVKTSDTGVTGTDLCFGVNIGEIEPGVYYNDYELTIEGVENNPLTVTLCLTVQAAPTSDSAFVTPDTLWFSAVQGGEPPAFECAELTSTNAPAHFVVAGISGSPVFTTANADSGMTPNNVCFSVDQSGLDPGAHYNTVSLEVNGVDNNPVDLVICLLVEAAPVLDSAFISPDTAFFTIVQNSGDMDTGCVAVLSTNAPASYTIGVVDLLPGRRTDTAHIFVDLLADGGMTNDTVCYTVSAAGRAPGVYYNTLSAEVDGVENNPLSSVVCLTVLEEPPIDPSILAISDTLFSYSADSGSMDLIYDTLFVINAGLGPDFGWTIEKQYSLMISSLGDTTYDSSGAIPAEITLDQLNGVTPGFAAFTVDASALNPGYYMCAFWVVADSGVQNSPQRFDVELTVNEPIVDTMLTVFFDIKPGSCPNPINTRGEDRQGKAVVPVALLGTEDFDVNDIDVSTVRLEGVVPARHSYEDVTAPPENTSECDCVEAEPDGYVDLTIKFYRSQLIDALGDLSDVDATELVITGQLHDGTAFEAYDCIKIVPGPKGPKGGASMSAILNGEAGDPVDFDLVGNYPNPFNPSTAIVYGVPVSSHVTLSVYNVAGQKIATLVDGVMPAGYHSVKWDAQDVASGVYLYRMDAANTSLTRKMVLLK